MADTTNTVETINVVGYRRSLRSRSARLAKANERYIKNYFQQVQEACANGTLVRCEELSLAERKKLKSQFKPAQTVC